MVLHGIELYLMVLHTFARHCIVLYGIAWYRIISYGIAWYCIIGFSARAVSRKTSTLSSSLNGCSPKRNEPCVFHTYYCADLTPMN